MSGLLHSPAALRQLLAERFPPSRPRPAELLPTGISALDEAIGGGLPAGGLTEVVALGPSSGGQLFISRLLAATRSTRGRAALVDGRDAFDPPSHEPETLRHLLWVRCRTFAEAMQAMDILVRDANLALVMADLRDFDPRECRRLPVTAWYRLQRAAEQTGLAALILTPAALVGGAQLRLALRDGFHLGDFDEERGRLIERLPFEVQRSRAQAGKEDGVSFVVLHVANFALQAVARAEPALEDWVMALLLDRSKKATVVEANAAARAAGVEIGFTAPQAMARCAAIVLRVRSPAAEAEAEAALIAIAKSLSPRAERTAPGICTVDLAGRPADTYGALGCEAVERLRSFGLAATAGIARTPLLALYAAHQAQPVLEVGDERVFLAALPLALADPAPALEAILEGWGIVTLGAFTALPKSDISRRLGQAGVDLWERAAGEADRPIESLPAEESFEAAMDWEQEIETLEPLLFILRRFVDRLALQLANAGLVAAKLSLELRLADETFYRREFRLPEPAGDPEILFRALHTHLETLHTGAAIAGAKLALSPTRPLVRQGGIFEAGLRDPHGFAETLARVEAIVGSSGVGTPCPEATHRPDAFALEKPAAVVGAMPAPPVLPPLGLPLRRFRPPLAAGVESDGPAPVGVRCDAVRGRVRCARGPWRGSGDWWKPERWDREEWDVELEDGGIFRLCRTAGRWWVEGMYD